MWTFKAIYIKASGKAPSKNCVTSTKKKLKNEQA